MNKNKFFATFFIVFIGLIFSQVSILKAEEVPTEFRFRFSGSSVFSMPTANCTSSVSYLNDDGESNCFISQSFGQIIEVSLLRILSGDFKSKNTINGKLAFLTEGKFTPAISLGVADVNKQLGDRIFFAAASKNFEDFGFSIHAGLCKDPVDDEKKAFFGVQKVIFPLLTVAAERYDDVNTYGIKISPYPGVSLDIAQRDGKEEMFNLVYSKSY